MYAKAGSAKGAGEVLAMLQKLLGVLGLAVEEKEEIPQEILDMAAQRTEARTAKHWQKADELRDEIQKRGFILEDTPQEMCIRDRYKIPAGGAVTVANADGSEVDATSYASVADLAHKAGFKDVKLAEK